MFIKSDGFLNIGDRVVLTKDMKNIAGTFEEGTTLKVIGITARGYDFEDVFGNRLLETGLHKNFYREL